MIACLNPRVFFLYIFIFLTSHIASWTFLWPRDKSEIALECGHFFLFFQSITLESLCVPVKKEEEEEEKAPLCLVKSRRFEGRIAYRDDLCPIEARNYLPVMTLLSPAPSERLRRMRPRGVLPPRQQREGWDTPPIFPPCQELCPGARRGTRRLYKPAWRARPGGICTAPPVHYPA